ncbi:MFS transporter [Nocardioides panzhihuensis]|uniref:MFS family permease n=1 Tax=Nocardioides panzhihuensis TaxID=860243 RepID=A0A7Z0DLZ6_9ACTN|nr:MFS transporter [Nocardioides panzhihuensis]NYI77697.1 MFS family permease [Nocardioides panzhihuensis]
MTTTSRVDTDGSDLTSTKGGVARLAFASGVGTSLEFYDFAIYGTATALVFTDTFFRTDDPWFSTFMGLATFAIGFLMAPVGAVLFGWVGDRYGRKSALLMTFIGMGVATMVMGMLPTYAQIGVAAPIMLVLLRMVHGLCRGGETGGAAVLAIEHAPDDKRARYGVFVALGSPIGSILANLAFAAVLLLPAASVESWGWRIPFLIGGVVLFLGIWIRHGVSESPVFQQMMREEGETLKKNQLPVFAVLKTNWRRVVLAAGVNIGLNASTFALVTFMLSYATAAAPEGLGLPRQPIVNASIAALVMHAVANVLAAWAADRLGRRPVMMAGAVGSIASGLVIFHLAETGSVAGVATAMIIGFTTTGFLFGPMYTFFTELFPREQRQSGMGVSFHVGAVLGGGISPLIANRIIASTGEPTYVGYYLAAMCGLSLLCLCLLPETAPRALARAKLRTQFS